MAEPIGEPDCYNLDGCKRAQECFDGTCDERQPEGTRG